jgi:hypothetical protein
MIDNHSKDITTLQQQQKSSYENTGQFSLIFSKLIWKKVKWWLCLGQFNIIRKEQWSKHDFNNLPRRLTENK